MPAMSFSGTPWMKRCAAVPTSTAIAVEATSAAAAAAKTSHALCFSSEANSKVAS